MNIARATKDYEAWMASQVSVVKADLAAKHAQMTADAFSFLRATFYRWAQVFPSQCPELNGAPRVLGVGDLHVENFGTWRDAEGRLVWGVNDFDEACLLPYTSDLVRLATSAWLAIDLEHLAVRRGDACKAILAGYAAGLEEGGRPFVLSECNRWLRDAVTGRLRDPTRFWEKLAALPTMKNVPPEVTALLRSALPETGLQFRVVHRQAGLGSLGRPRFMALAEWRGGKIAREAKALLPAAWSRAGGLNPDARIYYDEILRGAVRASDPFVQVRNGWVLRRLSPYCSRIELKQLPQSSDQEKLLRAMGAELANVHLAKRGIVARVRADLKGRKSRWLRNAAEVMAEVVLEDWKAWRKRSS